MHKNGEDRPRRAPVDGVGHPWMEFVKEAEHGIDPPSVRGTRNVACFKVPDGLTVRLVWHAIDHASC